MKAALAELASLAVIAFAASSMVSIGLAYGLREIVGPLRHAPRHSAPRWLTKKTIRSFHQHASALC